MIAENRQKLRLLGGALALAVLVLVGCETDPNVNEPQTRATVNFLDPGYVAPNELAAVGLPRGCVLRWRDVHWPEWDSDKEGTLRGALMVPADASIFAVKSSRIEIAQARTPAGELLQPQKSRYSGVYSSMGHVSDPQLKWVYAKLPREAERYNSLEDVQGRVCVRIATEKKIVEIDAGSREWVMLSPGLKVRLIHVAGADRAPADSDSADLFSADFEVIFQVDSPYAVQTIMSVVAVDTEGNAGHPFMSGGGMLDQKYYAKYSFRVDPPFRKFQLVIAEKWIERELPFHIDHLPLRLNETP